MTFSTVESVAVLPAGLDRSILHRNLDSLRAEQPTIAILVERASLPGGAQAAVGRDGVATAKFVGENGRWCWFGGSSMPTVSAAEMFAAVSSDAGNVTLPGIGSGFEVLSILKRLPAYRAVFVIEDDAANLRLAFCLHDFSRAIQERRLVFARGESLADDLLTYFEAHFGHELPTRMFSVPWRTASATAELQRKLELAGERVLECQSRAVGRLTQVAAGRTFETLADSPRCAVVSTDPSATTRRWAFRAISEMRRLGWSAMESLPDAPDKCHFVARLAAVVESQVDWVLSVGAAAGALRNLLPKELPIVTWLPLGCDAPTGLIASAGPADIFAAVSREQIEALKVVGVPSRAMLVFGIVESSGKCMTTRGRSIAVMCDVPDARANACGINLQSHVALWEEMTRVARMRASANQLDANDIFQAASSSSGVRVMETKVVKHFTTLCRVRLILAVQASAMVAALRRAKCEVTVWGAGWSTLPDGGMSSMGPLPVGENGWDSLSAGVVVIPTMRAADVVVAMDALSDGRGVVILGTRHEFEHEYPGLAKAAESIVFCKAVADLPRCVDSAISNPVRPTGGDASMAEFLVCLRNQVRRLQAEQSMMGGMS